MFSWWFSCEVLLIYFEKKYSLIWATTRIPTQPFRFSLFTRLVANVYLSRREFVIQFTMPKHLFVSLQIQNIIHIILVIAVRISGNWESSSALRIFLNGGQTLGRLDPNIHLVSIRISFLEILLASVIYSNFCRFVWILDSFIVFAKFWSSDLYSGCGHI